MSIDNVLQRALSIRLNLQISLSSLPFVEEWMDIHLDRWLEHVPMPPEMPDGHQAHYRAILGADLRRMWWGAWGHPRGFVPKMADYFKLCNMAKSDEAVIDEMGEKLQPELVGSWVGVWGGKVITGWHFGDPQPWDKVEPLFGTHEAKFLLKKWITDHNLGRIERFMQSIGETAFSELEIRAPGDDVGSQVEAVSRAFAHFTGAPLSAAVADILKNATNPDLSTTVRIRGGKVVRFSTVASGLDLSSVKALCAEARTGYDEKLERVVPAIAAEGIDGVEYGRAGEHAGVDVHIVPTEAAAKGKPAVPVAPVN